MFGAGVGSGVGLGVERGAGFGVGSWVRVLTVSVSFWSNLLLS